MMIHQPRSLMVFSCVFWLMLAACAYGQEAVPAPGVPRDLDRILQESLNAYQRGDLDVAAKGYRILADLDDPPDRGLQLQGVLGLVRVHRARLDHQEALKELNALGEDDDRNNLIEVRLAKAMVHYELESFEEAMQEVDWILNNDPKCVDAVLLKGKILFQRKELHGLEIPDLKPTLTLGEPLKINLFDPALDDEGLEIKIRVVSRLGDRETVILKAVPDRKGKYRGVLNSIEGDPAKGDGVLQSRAGDLLEMGYHPDFDPRAHGLPEVSSECMVVAPD